ncbi:TetR family transcriptional regulator [Streptomyces sp. SCUT-3]|uniref:TetR/AcrR family transcriptional regulator n=1 Tax=Streptomyces sp. SCUT-3 TaxID=2684469 RepID=UPI000CBD7E93|nr:TetR/AcrR family transcriptional regulator [Streptomyces sp. SCUT-3]PLW65843.1 TetR/AcrR family transcriptional regulator [Streptomyces sp. DJ]QMV20633.1 TetR family transcriptional regulator [Streptomyces sp. SCUT-3]
MTSFPARNRRADARRSRTAILDAAARVLNADPDAGLEAIATAAGVTRQTVYAHFPSREQLLIAVVDRLTQEAVAAMDAAEPDAGPAADALLRLLDASAGTLRRFPVLLRKISSLPVGPQADHDRHTPVADRIKRVVQRGRQAGEFDDRLPLDWLVTATIRLAHAASEERDAGRLSGDEAEDALRTSLLRILGAASGDGCPPRPR